MTAALIVTPTGNMSRTRDFYERLGFAELMTRQAVFVTDGKVVIELDAKPGARTALKLVRDDWAAVLDTLVPARALEMDGGYLVADPNGVRVHLVEGDAAAFPAAPGKSFADIGNFVGLSIEAVDFAATVGFWLLLGYGAPAQEMEDWAALTNNNSVDVTIMDALSCPHLFSNPSLTYFNGQDNGAVIEHIRAEGIEIAEEITVFNDAGDVDNIIIRDPGGTGFFVFNN